MGVYQIGLKGMGYEDLEWIYRAQDNVQWRNILIR